MWTPMTQFAYLRRLYFNNLLPLLFLFLIFIFDEAFLISVLILQWDTLSRFFTMIYIEQIVIYILCVINIYISTILAYGRFCKK